jgi:hypothetical protein
MPASARICDMAEEPKKEGKGNQGSDQKDNSWGYLKEFFLANSTVVLSVLYVYVTAVGMLHSATLYRNFGITIFDFSEIGDFLLAAFKKPLALLLGVLQAFLYGAIALSTLRYIKVYEAPNAIEKYKRWTTVALSATLIVLGSVLPPYVTATFMASSIKHREHPTVDVRYRSFSGSAGQVTEPDLKLIGATQKAVFFYDVSDKRTLVIPQTQIVSMEVPE